MSLPNLSNNQNSSAGIGPIASGSQSGFVVSHFVSVGVSVVLLFAGWTLFVIFGAGPALGFKLGASNDHADPNPDTTTDTNEATTSASEPNTPNDADSGDSASHLCQTLLLVQKCEFEPRLNRIRDVLRAAKKQLTEWNDRVGQLMNSDGGGRLANVEAAERFRILLRQCPMTTQDLKSCEDSLELLASYIQKATAPLGNLDDVDQELAGIEARLLSSTAQLTGLDLALDELQAGAAADPSSRRTLAAFLESLDERLTQDKQQTIDSAMTSLRERLATELADADQQKKELEATLLTQQTASEDFLKSVARETEASKRQSDELASDLASKRADARKAMERELPSMRSLLSPFITHGYRQPCIGEFTVVVDRQPVSYGALVRLGALEDTQDGLLNLLHAGETRENSLCNDRPLGSFPDGSDAAMRNPDTRAKLEQVQQFLKKHSAAMVEAKLLVP